MQRATHGGLCLWIFRFSKVRIERKILFCTETAIKKYYWLLSDLIAERMLIMNVIWCDREHKEFYNWALSLSEQNDAYHKALFYALGCCPDARDNIDTLYDFALHQINPDVFNLGWITGGSRRLVLMAYNLFNGFVLNGCEKLSTPYELFDCDYAPYMMIAIQLRYPDFFRKKMAWLI